MRSRMLAGDAWAQGCFWPPARTRRPTSISVPTPGPGQQQRGGDRCRPARAAAQAAGR